jgi:hypothetical protein
MFPFGLSQRTLVHDRNLYKIDHSRVRWVKEDIAASRTATACQNEHTIDISASASASVWHH